MKVVLFPFSSSIAKNLPNIYWYEIIKLLDRYNVKLSYICSNDQNVDFKCEKIISPNFEMLEKIYLESDFFIGVDTAGVHIVEYFNKKHNLKKQCICLYTQSNPALFGYESNINIHSPYFYRINQYDVWIGCNINFDALPDLNFILKIIDEYIISILSKDKDNKK